jgi:hypothetical protein
LDCWSGLGAELFGGAHASRVAGQDETGEGAAARRGLKTHGAAGLLRYLGDDGESEA